MFIEFNKRYGDGFTSEAQYSDISEPDRQKNGGRRAEMIIPMRLHDEAGRIPWQDNC